MAFKIFNIGKANEEVTRLENEIAKLTADNAAQAENFKAIEDQATKLSADLSAAQQTIATHAAESAKSAEMFTQLNKERDELAVKLAEKVDPSAQALAIVAAQGAKPVPVKAELGHTGNEPKTFAEKAMAAAFAKASARAVN